MGNGLKFRRLGTMVDCSRNAVMNVSAVKRWIDVTSDLGYNVLGLYIEDTPDSSEFNKNGAAAKFFAAALLVFNHPDNMCWQIGT